MSISYLAEYVVSWSTECFQTWRDENFVPFYHLMKKVGITLLNRARLLTNDLDHGEIELTAMLNMHCFVKRIWRDLKGSRFLMTKVIKILYPRVIFGFIHV